MNAFTSQDSHGMDVSLRALPSDEEALVRNDNTFEDDLDWEDTILLQAQLVPWLPQWWALQPGCTHQDCSCEALDLVSALERLPVNERSRAVEAHLETLQVLSRHYGAALGVQSGGLTDEVCVGCVADLDEHLQTLEVHLAAMGRSIGDALSSGLVKLYAH